MKSLSASLVLCTISSLAGVAAVGPVTIESTGPDTFSLTWPGELLRPYQVEASPDLQSWMSIPPIQIGTGAPLGMQILPEPGTPLPNRFFYRVREGAIRPGFNSDHLENGDDSEVSKHADLGFSIRFGGQLWDKCWVNNNGNITFESDFGSFHPKPLVSYQDRAVIATFWGDVDTRGIPPGFSGPINVSFGQGFVDGASAFGVNWVDTGYFSYSGGHYDKLNSFQLVLIDRSATNGTGAFDVEFNYNQILWETGDASDGIDGYDGEVATVGISDGNDLALEVEGSGESLALLDTIVTYDAGSNTHTDTGGPHYPTVGIPGTGGLKYRTHANPVPGRLLFKIRGGRYFDGLVNVDAGTPSTINAAQGWFRVQGSATVPTGATQVSYLWTVQSGSAVIQNPNQATTIVLVNPGTAAILKLTVEVEFDGIVAKTADTVYISNR